jgi:hypothetical protein
MCSLADDVEITDPLSLSIFLSVVSVLDHRYLLKKWPMKELGIALERSEKETNLKFVLIPMLLEPLSFEDINNAVKKKEPNLYSNIDMWEGVKWGTDDLKELRLNVPQHDIPIWRSSLDALMGIVMMRGDQVKREEEKTSQLVDSEAQLLMNMPI